jgi:hypothetical protein
VLREIAEAIVLIEDHPFAGRARDEAVQADLLWATPS